MKWIREGFMRLWAVWVLISFVSTGIVIFIGFLIVFSLTKKFHPGQVLSRIWSAIFLYLTGMPVKVVGRRPKFPRGKPYILISNHFSQLDIPITMVANGDDYKFLSKKEVLKMPVIGLALKRLHLTVDRKSKESRAESLRLMKKTLLEDRLSLAIFPEGTRNPGPHTTKAFYDGAFRLAIETGVPVVVQTVLNSWSRQNAHMGFRFNPGIVLVKYDEPILTANLTEDDLPALKEQVRQIMDAHISEYYRQPTLPPLV